VIITGGARGIGLAVAERALESGADVSLWDVDGERLARTSAELSAKYKERKVSDAVVELTDESSVDAAAKKTFAAHGRIDVLVNNAGITGGNGTTWELAPDVWRRVIDVNLIGPYLTCRAVVPYMLKAGYGRIVNIASIAGKEGNPNASAYSAAKAGVIALTKSLGKETAALDIAVNAITPAAARTKIFEQMAQQHIDYMLSKIPRGRFVEVNEIASMVAWLVSKENSFTTGAVFDLSGGRATY
jgi:3-oxoacyl-[acyl-carrier protein] reductase